MTRRMGSLMLLVPGCVSLWHCVGCKTPEETTATLEMLRQAKARGHLVVASDGAVEVGQSTSFFLGARGTRIMFDGDIDFTEGP